MIKVKQNFYEQNDSRGAGGGLSVRNRFCSPKAIKQILRALSQFTTRVARLVVKVVQEFRKRRYRQRQKWRRQLFPFFHRFQYYRELSKKKKLKKKTHPKMYFRLEKIAKGHIYLMGPLVFFFLVLFLGGKNNPTYRKLTIQPTNKIKSLVKDANLRREEREWEG